MKHYTIAIVSSLTLIAGCGGPHQSDSSQRRELASDQQSGQQSEWQSDQQGEWQGDQQGDQQGQHQTRQQGEQRGHQQGEHHQARSQSQEQSAFDRDQDERYGAESTQARHGLGGQTEEPRARGEEARDDADRESSELSSTMERACSEVPEQARDTCPIERSEVDSVRNVASGVSVRLNSNNNGDFQARLDCYQARAELREGSESDTPGCIVDISDIDVDVGETRGRTEVRLTSSESGSVTELRSQAREMTSRARTASR